MNSQGARDLIAAIITRAIDDAKKVQAGRVVTFEKGTGLSGTQANHAFSRLGGRLRPWDDIEQFFAGQHFENLIEWLDQDAGRVRAALRAQGLIPVTRDGVHDEPRQSREVIYPKGVKTPQNGST